MPAAQEPTVRPPCGPTASSAASPARLSKLECRPRLRHQPGSLQSMEAEHPSRGRGIRRIASIGPQQSDIAPSIPEDTPVTCTGSGLLPSYRTETVNHCWSGSSGDSPTASLNSLPGSTGQTPVQPIPPAARRFCRSQTGTQLVGRGVWSRYALQNSNQRTSLNSSSSSLASTTSSTAVLLHHSTSNSTIHQKRSNVRRKSTVLGESTSAARARDFGSIELEGPSSTKPVSPPLRRSISGTLCSDLLESGGIYNYMNSTSTTSLDGTDHKARRRNSVSSAWKKASRSASRQMRHVVGKLTNANRSVSTGRLNLPTRTLYSGKSFNNANDALPSLRPPFYAYKVLPYLWVGDERAANNADLLSDGGSDHELRKIRRRVFVDFRPENARHHKFEWPRRQSHLFDYYLPITKRSRLTRNHLFRVIIEFCKVVNKARRDLKGTSQVLVYGPDGYNLAQIMAMGYLIAMYKEDPLSASDLVARNAPKVFVEEPLGIWLWDFKKFLDSQTTEALGQYTGDMVRVKKAEAEKAFNHQYIICRSEPHLTKDWTKYINSEVCVPPRSASTYTVPNTPLPLKVPATACNEDVEVAFETFDDEDEPLFLCERSSTRSGYTCADISTCRTNQSEGVADDPKTRQGKTKFKKSFRRKS